MQAWALQYTPQEEFFCCNGKFAKFRFHLWDFLRYRNDSLYIWSFKKNENLLIFSSVNLNILNQVSKLNSVNICVQEGFLPATGSLFLCRIVFGVYWGQKWTAGTIMQSLIVAWLYMILHVFVFFFSLTRTETSPSHYWRRDSPVVLIGRWASYHKVWINTEPLRKWLKIRGWEYGRSGLRAQHLSIWDLSLRKNTGLYLAGHYFNQFLISLYLWGSI